MPLRAHGVRIVALMSVRLLAEEIRPKAQKRTSLLLTIGPPMLTVYWWKFLQGAATASGCTRLLAQVLASNAVFWTFQTALPVNRFVPDRV